MYSNLYSYLSHLKAGSCKLYDTKNFRFNKPELNNLGL